MTDIIQLTEIENNDVLHMTKGDLRFEYTALQLDLILDLAEAHGIRAWDAAAFVAQMVFTNHTVLDSVGAPVTTLDALPRHDGINQRYFHACSKFPLSAVPPTWFLEGETPNVTLTWRYHCANRRQTRVSSAAP